LPNSIYARGILTVGAFFIVATLVTTTWLAYDRHQDLADRLKFNLDNLSSLQASAVSDAVWNQNPDVANDILAAMSIHTNFHSARIITWGGDLFTEISGPPLLNKQLITSTSNISANDGKTLQPLGYVELSFSLERLTEQQRRSLLEALAIGLFQLFAILLATRLVLRRVIKPVELITKWLVGLTRNEIETDFPATGRDDQIGDMARAVSSLVGNSGVDIPLQVEDTEAVAELEQIQNIVREANQPRSEFLSSIGHELRTPLNAILGFAQILEYDKDNPLTESQAESVSIIKDSGERLLQLIEEISFMAKIDSGKISISIENISVNNCIDECIALLNPTAQHRGIHISFHSSSREYLIRADSTLLGQVILNLLSNAIQYGNKDGTIDIRLSTTANDFLHLEIADNGIGIANQQKPDLFRPFNRSAIENAITEDRSIGLYASKELLRLMGGRIGFESEIDQGSTFWAELPLALNAKTPTVEGVVIVPELVNDQTSRLTGRILYVEDNLANLKLMQGIIRLCDGLTLISVHNAELGLEMASTQNPDLIILDINLPGMSGLEALNRLKQMQVVPKIPVIALSAAGTDSDIQKGLDAGFHKYLTKPVNIKEVLDAINTLLRN